MKSLLASLFVASAAFAVPLAANATPSIVWTPITSLGSVSDVQDIAVCQDFFFVLGAPIPIFGGTWVPLKYTTLTHSESWGTLPLTTARYLPPDMAEITGGDSKLYVRSSIYFRDFYFLDGSLGGGSYDPRLHDMPGTFLFLESLSAARRLSMVDRSQRLWALNDDNSIWEGLTATPWYGDASQGNPYNFSYQGAPSTTPTFKVLTVVDDGAIFTAGSDQPLAIGVVPTAAPGSRILQNRRGSTSWNMATANWTTVTTSSTNASYPAWYIEPNLIDLETIRYGSQTLIYGLAALPSNQRIVVRGVYTP